MDWLLVFLTCANIFLGGGNNRTKCLFSKEMSFKSTIGKFVSFMPVVIEIPSCFCGVISLKEVGIVQAASASFPLPQKFRIRKHKPCQGILNTQGCFGL